MFQVLPRPVVTSAAPFILDAVGGRLVLGGLHFLSTPEAPLRCFLGDSAGPPGEGVPARLVSSALLECGGVPGGAKALRGQEAADWRVEVGLDHPATESRVGFRVFRGIDAASMISLAPAAGKTSGGELVEVRSGGLPQFGDSECRVGTFTGVVARRTAADRLQCAMPAHSPGAVGITLGLRGGQVYMQEELEFMFRNDAALDFVIPERAFGSSSGAVRLHGSEIPPAPACFFDAWQQSAVRIGRDWAECSLPGDLRGFSAVALDAVGAPGVEIEVIEPAAVARVAPAVVEAGSGGVVLHLTGSHMGEGRACVLAGPQLDEAGSWLLVDYE